MAFIWAQNWANSPNTASICVLLGVVLHVSVIPYDIDHAARGLVVAYLIAWAGLAATLSLWEGSIGSLSFLAGFGASTVVYRLFFHRLRSFPGPWSHKISRLFTVGSVLQSDVRYHLVLEKLHQEHGDFVRTGPREISVIRPSAVRTVFGPQSRCRKASFYTQVGHEDSKLSVLATRDPEKHRQRRRTWDRGLGSKALASYTPHIKAKTDALMSQLHARAHASESITITQWTMYFSFDVMGIIAFGKDFLQLEDATEHYAIAAMHEQMLMMGVFTPIPWMIYLLLYFPALSGSYAKFQKYSADQIEEKKKVWLSGAEENPTDLVSWLLKGKDELRNVHLEEEALHEDGRLAIIAGSDTTGSTLSNILYLLSQHPDKYARLRREVDDAGDGFTNGTSKLPYLDAVITETLRIKPVVPSAIPRVTPPEGLMIDEVWIPGNTIVAVPSYVVQRDERSFVRPLEFIPERWLDEKHLVIHETSWFPFSIGTDSCAGKQLALQQMRGVIGRIAKEFDISLAPGEDGVAFDTMSQDTFTILLKPLEMVFKERQVSN